MTRRSFLSTIRRFSSLLPLAVIPGCQMARDPAVSAKAEILTGLSNKVADVDSRVGDVAGRVDHLDQSVRNIDDWTMRILAATPVLLFSYPIGKAIWLIGASVRRRTSVSSFVETANASNPVD